MGVGPQSAWSARLKLKVGIDADLYPDGVERVWAFTCPDPKCKELGVWRISTLYWENAVRAASHHAAWHSQKESQD